jgi:hypothetical protein
MRSLLDTEIKRQREGRGRRESPKRGSLYQGSKLAQIGTPAGGSGILN